MDSFVKIKHGVVKGGFEIFDGSKMYFFKGVPYAQAPMGELRFQPPQPLQKFTTNELDCTSHRSEATQKDMFSSEYIGSEDCLYLNVYTPSTDGKYPVMIFIHGGAFSGGSGNDNLYSPEFLVKNGVIVVTINYRLGPLGFLFCPQIGIEGNMGLKDQQMAMAWVQENISAFGGDPTNVTVLGESAGGVSCNFHLLNASSRRLFHKAIYQSGTVLNDWVLQVQPVEKAVKLAQLLGAQSDRDILKVLMTADAKKITRLANKTLTPDEWRRGLPMPFKPAVERPNSTAIFTEHPLKLLKQMDIYEGIPVMSGVTDMEGILMMQVGARKKIESYNKDVCKFLPLSLNLTPDSTMSVTIGKEIQQFYLGRQENEIQNKIQMTKFLTDFHFSVHHYATAELVARHQPNSKQFLYKFSFDGALNYFKQVFGGDIPGACHIDELSYLFRMRMFDTEVSNDSEEAKMRRQMCQLWTSFAKFGNPTSSGDSNIKWNPVGKIEQSSEKVTLQCLELNRDFRMETNPDKERIDFWRSLYKTWNGDFIKPKL